MPKQTLCIGHRFRSNDLQQKKGDIDLQNRIQSAQEAVKDTKKAKRIANDRALIQQLVLEDVENAEVYVEFHLKMTGDSKVGIRNGTHIIDRHRTLHNTHGNAFFN